MGKVYYIMAVFAAIFFTACQEDDFRGDTQGGIRITLAEEVGVDVTTRSTPEELTIPIEKDFTLKVVDQATNDTIYNGKYTSEIIPVSAGTYTIIAEYGEDVVLDADKPYYKGIAEDVQVSNSVIDASISCSVANALVSVILEDETTFKQLYPSAYFKVKIGNTEKNFSDYSQSAYFKAGSSLSLLTLYKNRTDGDHIDLLAKAKEVLKDDFPDPFKAKDHLKITLGLENTGSGVSIKVVKAKIDTITISETIPLEWLPKPKVEATGFDNNNTLTFAETETKEAKLNLKLASALQDMRLKFNFGDAQFSHLNRDTGYLYSNAEDKAVIETTLGISVSDDNINLNNLLAQIKTNAGETTTNTIEVDVKANNRWSSEDEAANRTYTITCNKPVFKVDAYPGNIWTKEFTMNALREEQVESGDFSKISQNIKYQYSTDGESNWTDLDDGLRQANLTPGTTYYIRGLYRDAVPGEVTEVSTYPVIPLENGDMEYWTEEERGYYYDANIFNSNDPKLRVYYPWNSESFWNTNNNFTTRNRDASTAAFSIVYRYNSFPAVSYTKDANSGTWAAELRNTAAGRGNVSSSESSYEFNNVPGELFIGDISVSEGGTEIIPDDSYSINKGRAFVSRPTALRFYYKYAPYNTDSWKVYIALYDFDDNIIAENTVTGGSQSSYKNIDVPFNYTDDMNVVPAKIYVYFASSIYSGNQLPYHKMNVTTWYKDSQRTDETLSGSVFTIDDIELIYDK